MADTLIHIQLIFLQTAWAVCFYINQAIWDKSPRVVVIGILDKLFWLTKIFRHIWTES